MKSPASHPGAFFRAGRNGRPFSAPRAPAFSFSSAAGGGCGDGGRCEHRRSGAWFRLGASAGERHEPRMARRPFGRVPRHARDHPRAVGDRQAPGARRLHQRHPSARDPAGESGRRDRGRCGARRDRAWRRCGRGAAASRAPREGGACDPLAPRELHGVPGRGRHGARPARRVRVRLARARDGDRRAGPQCAARARQRGRRGGGGRGRAREVARVRGGGGARRRRRLPYTARS